MTTEIQIIGERKNELFGRKEIKGIIKTEKSPERHDVLNALSKKFSVAPETIQIKKINGKFGSNNFELEANIYSSRDEKESIELKKKKDAELEKKASAKLHEQLTESVQISEQEQPNKKAQEENTEKETKEESNQQKTEENSNA